MKRRNEVQKELQNHLLKFRMLGLNSHEVILDILYRVLATKEILSLNNFNYTPVVKVMLENGLSKEELTIDGTQLNMFYDSISKLSDAMIMDLIPRNNWELNTSEALLNNFKKDILNKINCYNKVPSHLKIFVSDCEQYRSGLIRFIEDMSKINGCNVSITLSSKDWMICEVLRKLLAKYGPCVDIINTDVFRYGNWANPELLKNYNAVIVIPPFMSISRQIDNKQNNVFDLNHLYDWTHTLVENNNALKSLFAVVPMSFCVSRRTGFARGEFTKSGLLEEISILPGDVLGLSKSLKLALIKTGYFGGIGKEIAIKEYEIAQDNSSLKVLKEAKVISNDKFIVNSENINGWNLLQYLFKIDNVEQKFASTVKRLGDFITVIRGRLPINRSNANDYAGDSIKIVNISNITEDGQIDFSNLESVDSDIEKEERFLLTEGDLLMSIKGTNIKTAVYKGEHGYCVPSPNMCMIRPKNPNELSSHFLKLFFDLPYGKTLLQSIKRGAIISNISQQDILELQIPIPNIQIQHELVKMYEDGFKQYIKEISYSKEKWQEIQDKISQSF